MINNYKVFSNGRSADAVIKTLADALKSEGYTKHFIDTIVECAKSKSSYKELMDYAKTWISSLNTIYVSRMINEGKVEVRFYKKKNI